MGRNYIESAELLRRGEESAQFKTIEALDNDKVLDDMQKARRP